MITILLCGGCGDDDTTAPTPVYWSTVASPTNRVLYDVEVVSSTDVWIVGDYGSFVHYDGQNWGVELTTITNDVYCLDMISANRGWAGGGGGIVYHYDGTEWERVDQPLTTNNLYGCHFTSDTQGWFVGDAGTILQYDNGNWVLHNSPSTQKLRAIYVPSANAGWVCGNSGAILRYRNAQWELVNSPTSHDLYDLEYFSADDVRMCGGGGTLVRISGGAVAIQDIASDQLLSAVWFFNTNHGWVATSKGDLFHYQAGSWSNGGFHHRAGINDLAFVDADLGYACGAGGTILKYEYK
jgi:photosystem II stability/assembly factor-like uncharacterized protein